MIVFKRLVITGRQEKIAEIVESPVIDTEKNAASANTVDDSIKLKTSSYLNDMTRRH